MTTARVLLMVSAVSIKNYKKSIHPIELYRPVSERRDSPLSETGLLIFIGLMVNLLEPFKPDTQLGRNLRVLRKLLYVFKRL